jgi:hypothetical protein
VAFGWKVRCNLLYLVEYDFLEKMLHEIQSLRGDLQWLRSYPRLNLVRRCLSVLLLCEHDRFGGQLLERADEG